MSTINFDSYYPFDAGPGANATETAWRSMARTWIPDGVIMGIGTECAVYADSTGMRVKVPAGGVAVSGVHAESTSEKVLVIGAATAQVRNDLVVARVDAVNNVVTFAVVQGVPGGAIPTPARTADLVEIVLAVVNVKANAVTIAAGDVTDYRPRANPAGDLTFPSAAARDLNVPTPNRGARCYLLNVEHLCCHDGTRWYVLDARTKRFNAFNSAEVVFQTNTTLLTITLPPQAPPGSYHVSLIGQFWTANVLTLTLCKNGNAFAGASAGGAGTPDNATHAMQSAANCVAGDVVSFKGSAPGAAGMRVGGNLFATWNGDF